MSQNIKQLIAKEYTKCAADPVHFMRKYCYIQHPTKGKILFKSWGEILDYRLLYGKELST